MLIYYASILIESLQRTVSKDTLKIKYSVGGYKLHRKSGRLFFKSLVTVGLLAIILSFGWQQLSHIGTEEWSILLKLPTPEKSDQITRQSADSNISIPSTDLRLDNQIRID